MWVLALAIEEELKRQGTISSLIPKTPTFSAVSNSPSTATFRPAFVRQVTADVVDSERRHDPEIASEDLCWFPTFISF